MSIKVILLYRNWNKYQTKLNLKREEDDTIYIPCFLPSIHLKFLHFNEVKTFYNFQNWENLGIKMTSPSYILLNESNRLGFENPKSHRFIVISLASVHEMIWSETEHLF